MAFSLMVKCLLFTASLTNLLAHAFPGESYNHLLPGEELSSGDSLRTGELRFTMQYDCNLVLYESDRAIWASGTNGKSSDCELSLQEDGNLVVNDFTASLVWESDTDFGDGNYILILQKDRKVGLYSNPIWSTETNDDGSVGINIAAARNGTVRVSGAKQKGE